MSGGHFDYKQYVILDIANEIERLIQINNSTEKNDFGLDLGNHFSPKTIARFHEAVVTLKKAAIMAGRIDWLVSGDDGEETFHSRLNESLDKIAKGVK